MRPSCGAILQALSRGATVADLVRRYPDLRPEDVSRCLARAAALVAADEPPDPDETVPPAESSPDDAAISSIATAEPERPATIPGYEDLREIGRGGMGVVYKARQVGLNRPAALKMILAGSHAGTADLDRFRSEAEAVARLRHPNIVQIYEIGESEGHPFLSLEFVEGGSLADRLNGRPLAAREAAELVAVLARAVQHAHEKGIVHRDLKPANVLLTADGEPKITDFGLAKQLDTETNRTQSGAVMGTPAYMAPEQAGGKTREVGPAADIYSLGAILYECLTGRPPFQAETVLDTLLLVLDRDPVPVRALNPRIPRDLETICHKCLRKEPRHRYGKAQELADDLACFLAGEPIKARPPNLWERADRWVRRHPLLLAAYLLASSGLLGFLTFVGLPRTSLFGLYGLSDATLYQVVLPLTLTVLIVAVCTDRRLGLGIAAALGLGLGLVWYFVRGSWLQAALTGGVLLGALAGLLLGRDRRLLLVLVLPALAGLTAVGWFREGSVQPLVAGAFHGLVLGLIARLVAWSLRREPAIAILGAVLGACGGIALSVPWAPLLRPLLVDVGWGYYAEVTLALYAEIVAAFLAAVAASLLGRGR